MYVFCLTCGAVCAPAPVTEIAWGYRPGVDVVLRGVARYACEQCGGCWTSVPRWWHLADTLGGEVERRRLELRRWAHPRDLDDPRRRIEVAWEPVDPVVGGLTGLLVERGIWRIVDAEGRRAGIGAIPVGTPLLAEERSAEATDLWLSQDPVPRSWLVGWRRQLEVNHDGVPVEWLDAASPIELWLAAHDLSLWPVRDYPVSHREAERWLWGWMARQRGARTG